MRSALCPQIILELELCGCNRRAVDVLEGELPAGFRRPAESNDRMLAFMKAKYIDGMFSLVSRVAHCIHCLLTPSIQSLRSFLPYVKSCHTL